MKVYISLPISGRPLEEVKAHALKLKKNHSGGLFTPIEVITPFDCSPHSEKPYPYHMGKCIEALLECDTVIFDEGWEESKGCRLEHQAAEIYGIKIIEYGKK